MPRTVFTNNARTTLSAGINSVVTSIAVTDGSVFPSPTGGDWAYLTIESGADIEIVKLTARSGNTLTVTRAQDGTTAKTFASGASISLRLNKAALDEIYTELDGKALSTHTHTLSQISDMSAFARTLNDDADAAAARTTLGLVIGTNVQAYNANLAAFAGLSLIADRLPYANGTGTLALATLTAAGRALLDDADAAAQRTTLGLGTAAIVNTGTSGATIPLLNGANTWSASQTIASANLNMTGSDAAKFLLASESALWRWTSASTAIDGLIPGTALGVILEGPLNGHVVIGIRGNDTSDGLYVIDNTNDGTNTYSRLLASLTPLALSYFGAQFLGPAGTAAAPAMSFSGDPNTGFYSESADSIGVSANGAQIAIINNTNFFATNMRWRGGPGAVGSPSIGFSGDTDTGFYWVTDGVTGYSQNGTLRFSLSSYFYGAATGSASIASAAGTALLPAYTFVGDENTGLYRPVADQIGITTGGVLRALFASTSISFYASSAYGNTLRAVSDTSASNWARIDWVNQNTANTGIIFLDQAGNFAVRNGVAGPIQFFQDATLRAVINATGQFAIGGTGLGTAATPDFTWAGDTNTGIYRSGADQFSIATGGIERFRVGSNGSLSGYIAAGTFTAMTLNGDGNTGVGPSLILNFTNAGAAPTVGNDIGRLTWNAFDSALATETYGYLGCTVDDATAGSEDATFYVTLINNGVREVKFSVSASGLGTFSERVHVGNGTAALPAYSTTGDPDTGWYWNSSGMWSYSQNGTARFNISDYFFGATDGGAIKSAAGTAALPALTFVNDTDTGLYPAGANILGFATAGAARFGMTTSFYGAGGTGAPAMTSAAGTVGAPAFTFITDTDTGLYRVGADQLGFSTGGALRLDISTTAVTSTLPILSPAGSAAAPSYSFSGDTNTGMFSDVADVLKLAVGGTERLRLNNANTQTVEILGQLNLTTALGTLRTKLDFGITQTGLTVSNEDNTPLSFRTTATNRVIITATGETQFTGGTVSLPGITFIGDPNTGIYRIGEDNIGFSVGGVKRFEMPSYANISIGPMWSQGNDPNFALVESDAAVDTKIWDMIMVGGTLIFRAVNDAYSSATPWLQVTRSTTTPNLATFSVPTVAPVAAGTETTGVLTSASAWRTIQLTGNITINNSVFAASNIIVVYAGASARTITQGTGVTMRLDGTATTGTRTLAAYGMATLFFVSASEVIVAGKGVT